MPKIFASLIFVLACPLFAQTIFNGGLVFIGQTGVNQSGTSAPTLPTLPSSAGFYVIGAPAQLVTGGIANPGFFSAARWDGTAASPTAVQSGEQIGGVNSYAYNGTTIAGPFGTFRCFANENQGTSNGGTACEVLTTPNASTTQASRVRFEADGGITVPSTVTGGDMGAGTLNATGLYVGGAATTTGPASSTTNDIPTFSDTSGKKLADSGAKIAFGFITMPASGGFAQATRDFWDSPADGQFEIKNNAGTGSGLAATNTGDRQACYSTAFQVTFGSVCGTSLAINKEQITTVAHGLDYVMRMRPVTFNWKNTGKLDLGMIADEVAAIDPLLGAYRDNGALYNFNDRAVLSTLIKAVQQIEAQVQELTQELKRAK